MSLFSPHLTKDLGYIDPAAGFIGRKDPVVKSVIGFLQKKPGPPGPQPAPTQDTAANAAIQTQDMLRRRKGILGNIYAGASPSAPAVASKTQLGT